MRKIVSNGEAVQRIKLVQPFRNKRGSLWGAPSGSILYLTYGELPEEYRASVRGARYVVFSYCTPIGWVTADGVKEVPDVGYSLTTGEHQYIVLHAWGIRRHPARGRELRPAGGGSRSGGMDDHR